MSFRTVLAVAALFIMSGCYTYHPYQYGHPGPYGGGPPRGVVIPPTDMPRGYTVPPGTEPPRIDDVQGGIEENERVPDYDDKDIEDVDQGGFGAVDGGTEGEEFAEYADEEFSPAGDAVEGGVEEFADLDDPPPGRTLTVSESERSETTPASGELNPYKYDPAYKWLRGVVAYDKQSDEWRITYNPESDSSDDYGGTLTLTNAQVLSSIDAQPDDVILVEGEVDPDNPDGQGKPTFYVEQADVLVPEE